ncbi:hypothetical protein NPIL_569451 [Nephila pilipes]|uniref:Secreted protein n=1 Tax=Nephila pilipes TaxID=299642 RepID=A0A8X6QLB2_NEPPI|nr:hypothetical protein NPIL_569451 [Nephila pilipes]
MSICVYLVSILAYLVRPPAGFCFRDYRVCIRAYRVRFSLPGTRYFPSALRPPSRRLFAPPLIDSLFTPALRSFNSWVSLLPTFKRSLIFLTSCFCSVIRSINPLF